MAIVDFNKVVSTAGNGTTAPTNPGALKSDGTNKFGYISDDDFNKNYPTYTGAPNPVQISLGNTEDGDESYHVKDYINKYKTAELAIATVDESKVALGSNLELKSNLWGGWRNDPSWKVSENVLLFPDNKQLKFSVQHEVESAWEKLSSTGILSKVQQAAELARSLALLTGSNAKEESGGKFMSKYAKVPVWTGTTPVSVDDVTFKFRFGQAGLFNGFEEVVKPIIAITKKFMPVKGDSLSSSFSKTALSEDDLAAFDALNKKYKASKNSDISTIEEFTWAADKFNENLFDGWGGLNSHGKEFWKAYQAVQSGTDEKSDAYTSSAYVKGPVPTTPSYLAALMAQFKEGIGSTAGAVIKNVADAGILDTVTGIENAVMSAQNNAIEKAIKDNNVKLVFLRLGRISMGPFIVKNIGWEFNFDQVDEFGFPFEGSVTLGGLEFYTLPLTDTPGNMVK